METLLEHLRTTGEERIRVIWQQAQAEVQGYRQEKEAVLAEERARCQLQGQQALLELGRALMVAAEERAWLRQSEAEAQLAARLYQLAQKDLPWVRAQCGSRLLFVCAQDLPQVTWGRVHVSESDLALARPLFPEAEVVGDRSISGGLVAESKDARITVINTLEKRLERAWSRILPGLFRALGEEKENGAS